MVLYLNIEIQHWRKTKLGFLVFPMAKDAIPRNWPATIPYLLQPMHSPVLTKDQRQALKNRAPDLAAEIPLNYPRGPSALVRILPIEDASHPAYKQAGLFAARTILPGSLIVPYYGIVHPSTSSHEAEGSREHEKSDYDLWLDRDANVAVDAEKAGNEARFVNDYRGASARPNAEFRECWDRRTGEKGMGVFALPAGKANVKKGGSGIRKGEEILVSYGKGFWEQRRLESNETRQ